MNQKAINFSGDGDGTPPEDADARRGRTRKRSRRANPSAAVSQDTQEKDLFLPPATEARRISFGRLEAGCHACYRCQSTEHDVVDERFASLLAECAFCGAMQWIQKPPRFRSPVIQSGQLKGLTVRQAMSVNRRLVEHMAARTPWIRDEMRSIDETPVAE